MTTSATSGRRLCLAYSPRSWQTARKSLFAGVAKSISRTCAPPMLPSGSLVLGRDAVDEETMDGAVAEVERRAFGVEELAEDVVQSLGRELRVQPGQGSPQPPFEDYLSVVGALGAGLVGRDLGAVYDRLVDRLEPVEVGCFDDGLGEGGHGDRPARSPAAANCRLPGRGKP